MFVAQVIRKVDESDQTLDPFLLSGQWNKFCFLPLNFFTTSGELLVPEVAVLVFQLCLG